MYVAQWLNGTHISYYQNTIGQSMSWVLTDDKYGYYAPSFAGTNNHLHIIPTFQDGLDIDKDIKLISSHK